MKLKQIKNIMKNESFKSVWIKTLYKENIKLNAKELAKVVANESGLECSEKDVIKCLYIHDEDFELESRKHLFSLKNRNYE